MVRRRDSVIRDYMRSLLVRRERLRKENVIIVVDEKRSGCSYCNTT